MLTKTPLLWAPRSGSDGVVKLLLEREDVGPDWPDNDGRTPLWWATRHRQKGVGSYSRPESLQLSARRKALEISPSVYVLTYVPILQHYQALYDNFYPLS